MSGNAILIKLEHPGPFDEPPNCTLARYVGSHHNLHFLQELVQLAEIVILWATFQTPDVEPFASKRLSQDIHRDLNKLLRSR